MEEELRPDTKVESKTAEAKKETQPSFPRPPTKTTMQKRPPKLRLPEEPTWDVYITCVHRYLFLSHQFLSTSLAVL